MRFLVIAALAVAVLGKPDDRQLKLSSTNHGISSNPAIASNTNNLNLKRRQRQSFGSLESQNNFQVHGYPTFEEKSSFGVLQPQISNDAFLGSVSSTPATIGRSLSDVQSQLSNAGSFGFGSSTVSPLLRSFQSSDIAGSLIPTTHNFQSFKIDSPDVVLPTNGPLLRSLGQSISSSTVSPLLKSDIESSNGGFEFVTPSSIGASSTLRPDILVNNEAVSNLGSFSLESLSPTISTFGTSGLGVSSTISPLVSINAIDQNPLALGNVESRFSGLDANEFNSVADFNSGSVDGNAFLQLQGFDSTNSFINGNLNENVDGESHTVLQSSDNQGTQVSKHLYFFEAPEEDEQPRSRQIVQLPPPQKTYKIIFIKAPSPPEPPSIEIPVAGQYDEQTLVYVLVKKPDLQQQVSVRRVGQPKPSKPEVFFIRYKTREEAEKAIADAQNGKLSEGLSVSAQSTEGIHLLNSLHKTHNIDLPAIDARSLSLDATPELINVPNFNAQSLGGSGITLENLGEARSISTGAFQSPIGANVNLLTRTVASQPGLSLIHSVPLLSTNPHTEIKSEDAPTTATANSQSTETTEPTNGEPDVFTSKTSTAESLDVSTTTVASTESATTSDDDKTGSSESSSNISLSRTIYRP